MDDHHFGYREKNSQRKHIAFHHAWCRILMVFLTHKFHPKSSSRNLQFISITNKLQHATTWVHMPRYIFHPKANIILNVYKVSMKHIC